MAAWATCSQVPQDKHYIWGRPGGVAVSVLIP